jgi:RNA recognition motif-containing protein
LYERQAFKDLHNLFVVNIPWEMKAQNLITVFKDFNPVASIINCSLTGKSLGSGIVGFNSIEDASEAKSKLNKAIIGGREIRVYFIIARVTFLH